MSRWSFSLSVLALALAHIACSGEETSPLTESCMAGSTQPCTCISGGSVETGLQVCASTGSFLACVCSGDRPDTPVGDDAGTVVSIHPKADAGTTEKHDDAGSCACDTPPGPTCSDGNTLVLSSLPGSCANNECSYTTESLFCANGCLNGACEGSDPCGSVTCDDPPAPSCSDTGTLLTYGAAGTCTSGECLYTPVATACDSAPANATSSCSDGACGFTCDSGYARSGDACVATASTSVPTTCAAADQDIGCCGPSGVNYYCGATTDTAPTAAACPAGSVCSWGTDGDGNSYYGCNAGTVATADPSGTYPIACQ
jgi:hypothetical protein